MFAGIARRNQFADGGLSIAAGKYDSLGKPLTWWEAVRDRSYRHMYVARPIWRYVHKTFNNTVFGRKNCASNNLHFLCALLCAASCALRSCERGGGLKTITDTRKGHQNRIECTKKSWKWLPALTKLDFHRFSLIFIEVLKMAENREKQVFTFFAFLPPYIGVSGSLVSRKR